MGYIKWLGHAAFEIEIDGKILYIDPWITNPMSPVKLADISRADLVLVTHDHDDHLGEAIDVVKKTGAKFISVYELTQYAISQGVPEDKAIAMNIGGVMVVDGIEVIMVPAHHSCTRGTPCGFIVRGKECSVYHAGDTGIVHEMSIIRELYPIDIALLPIGSVFTMDPRQAAKFTEILRPKVVIPMHYNTFPVIRQDPELFKRLVKEKVPEVEVVILKPGEVYRF
ncbi:MAG: metal-dependent hydrolase [Thermoprotei archaeon]|nr:MAG: metal-dependent hydrolase [Thermoprotei archaeon]